MSENDDEVKVTVEKLGKKISQSKEIKSFRYIERVDDAGCVHKLTEVQKNICDCGHVQEPAGVCSFPGCSFTICEACIKGNKGFVCSGCGQVCCPNHSVESILYKGVRYCNQCGVTAILRNALRRKNG